MSTPMESPIVDDLIMSDDTPTVPAPAPVPESEERPRDPRWGFLADGYTPRRKPGRPRNTTTTKAPKSSTPRARARRAAPGTTSKPSAPKPPPAAKKTTDYQGSISLALGLVLTPLSLLFPLDALAVTMRANEIISVGNQMANDIPSLGKILARAEQYVPYASGLTLAAGIAAQIGHNHGWLPEQAAVAMGAMPRTQLAALFMQQRQAAEADKNAEQARFDAAMAEAMATQQQAA